jgi:hypothetical protein
METHPPIKPTSFRSSSTGIRSLGGHSRANSRLLLALSRFSESASRRKRRVFLEQGTRSLIGLLDGSARFSYERFSLYSGLASLYWVCRCNYRSASSSFVLSSSTPVDATVLFLPFSLPITAAPSPPPPAASLFDAAVEILLLSGPQLGGRQRRKWGVLSVLPPPFLSPSCSCAPFASVCCLSPHPSPSANPPVSP